MSELTSGIGDTQEPQTNRDLTFGEKAVGLTFNPSNMPTVDRIKKLSAALIDEIASYRVPETNDGMYHEQQAMYTEAIRRIQEGQMWAVKAATWQY